MTAPRKIIDLGVINQESADGARDYKEAKRDRQTLLLIEQVPSVGERSGHVGAGGRGGDGEERWMWYGICL